MKEAFHGNLFAVIIHSVHDGQMKKVKVTETTETEWNKQINEK